jgi:hypothetical protein
LLIALSAILAAVTWSSPICIVSILPLTNSDESTELAANSEEPIAPAVIDSAVTELLAISLEPTAFACIFAAVTELPAN